MERFFLKDTIQEEKFNYLIFFIRDLIMNPEISIIIPTKDRFFVFIESLKAIKEAVKKLNAEIIVINDSKTESIKLPEGFDHVKVLDNPKSGVASARNLGALNAKASLLFFMDDDMLIVESNIIDLLETRKQYPNSVINPNWQYPPVLLAKIRKTQFGRFLIANNITNSKGWYNHPSWKDNSVFESYGITSQFLLIAKSDFEKSGGYDERFPHAGFEDWDIAMRFRKTGIKFYVNSQTTIYHNEADRIEPRQWLERKRRSGETRQVAVKIGYTEKRLTHGKLKSFIYEILIICKPVLYLMLRLIPNVTFFDKIYFRITHILLGTYLYEGFIKNRNKNII